jgi:hypothetical protein
MRFLQAIASFNTHRLPITTQITLLGTPVVYNEPRGCGVFVRGPRSRIGRRTEADPFCEGRRKTTAPRE